MKYQAVFERYEIKYIISQEQKKRVLEAIAPYMSIDEYGTTNQLIAFYPVTGLLLLATALSICTINMTLKKAAEH